MMGADYDEAEERARLRAARGECPVMVAVDIDDLCRLVDLAEICAQDLMAEIESRYEGDDGPTGQRRFARDMEPVSDTLALVEKLRGELPMSKNGADGPRQGQGQPSDH